MLGTIKDPSGAAIPSVTVQLLNTAKGVTTARESDGSGDYEFTNVQPGDYSITVTAPGFEKAETDRFTVTVGARQRVALVLKVGAEAQSVVRPPARPANSKPIPATGVRRCSPAKS